MRNEQKRTNTWGLFEDQSVETIRWNGLLDFMERHCSRPLFPEHVYKRATERFNEIKARAEELRGQSINDYVLARAAEEHDKARMTDEDFDETFFQTETLSQRAQEYIYELILGQNNADISDDQLLNLMNLSYSAPSFAIEEAKALEQ